MSLSLSARTFRHALVALLVAGACLTATTAHAAPLVAYVKGGKLVLRSADGTGKTRSIKTAHSPSILTWSPGGERLAIAEGRYDGAWTNGLQIYDVATGKLITVHTGQPFVSSPYFEAWSPNARYMVFTRAGTPLVFDLNTRSKTVIASADEYEWSPDGTRIALRRGSEVWVMSAPYGSASFVRDMSPWMSSNGFTVSWANDSSAVLCGYQESSVNHVYSLNMLTTGVTNLGAGPWGWGQPTSRDGVWTALNTTPPRLSNGVTSYVVGPNRGTAGIESVSSDGSWVSIMDWWGGAGQWDVWTCRRGGSPKKFPGGFFNELRPSPLASLSKPSFPSKLKPNVLATASGAEGLATASYPGPGVVVVRAQKKSGGTWHTKYLRVALLTGSGASRTYSVAFTLPRGTWRLRAERNGDIASAKVVSAWRMVTAK